MSTTYQRESNGKGKKAKNAKQQPQTFWNVRASAIRKLNRADQPAEPGASDSFEPQPAPETSDAPF